MSTHDIELPPLPEPSEAMSKWAYDEQDMQAYARAAIEADRQARGEPVAEVPSDAALEKAWDRFEAEMARQPANSDLEEFMAQFADENGCIHDDQHAEAARALLARYGQPAQPAAYKDNAPNLHVGESSFESWYSGYSPAGKGDKQRARDAYAAGMGDPLVTHAQPAASVKPVQPCLHKWGIEFSTHNHEPAKTVCVKCGHKPDTHALNTACEPVKVPSDADLNAAWHELTGRACLPGSIAHASARALLAKYSERPSKCSEHAGYTAEDMASQGAQGFRDGLAAAKRVIEDMQRQAANDHPEEP